MFDKESSWKATILWINIDNIFIFLSINIDKTTMAVKKLTCSCARAHMCVLETLARYFSRHAMICKSTYSFKSLRAILSQHGFTALLISSTGHGRQHGGWVFRWCCDEPGGLLGQCGLPNIYRFLHCITAGSEGILLFNSCFDLRPRWNCISIYPPYSEDNVLGSCLIHKVAVEKNAVIV